MKKLGDILNAIVNPFGKTLWKGTWTSESISVPDTDAIIRTIGKIHNGRTVRWGMGGHRNICCSASIKTVRTNLVRFYNKAFEVLHDRNLVVILPKGGAVA